MFKKKNRKISLNGSNLPDVIQRVDFGGEAAVNAEELLVHEGSQREAVECLHAGVIDPFRVLDFTCRNKKSQPKVKLVTLAVPIKRDMSKYKHYSHSCLKVKYSVRCLHSWLPRNR